MSIRVKLDAEKALEVLLYVAERCPDMYNALKVVYFADRAHLAAYGRLICGDSYVAMSHGPVPSGMYDMVKCARGDGITCWPELRIADSLEVRGNQLVPLRKANRDLLGESDEECLDKAIQTYKRMPFGMLKERSHDEAYKAADRSDFISLEDLAKSLPDGEELLAHLQDD